MNRFLLLSASAVLLAQASMAQAVTAGNGATYPKVIELNGVVMVDTGNGFKRVDNPLGVKAGDRVLVSSLSGAKIVYENGCTQLLKANSVTIVSTECKVVLQEGTKANINGAWYVVAALAGGGLIFALAGSGSEDNPPYIPISP